MPLDERPPLSVSNAVRQWAEKTGAKWSPVAGRFVTEAEREYWREINEMKKARLRRDASPVDACPRCGGLGVLNMEGKMVACDAPNCETRKALERERYAKLSTAARIPPIYADLTFAKWQALIDAEPEAMNGKWDAYIASLMFATCGGKFTLAEAAAAYGVDGPANGDGAYFASHSIVFAGKNGVGKTSLAVSIAHHLIDDGRAIVYTRLDELFDALKRTFNTDADEREDQVFETYRLAPVLIIDELTPDRAQPTDWQREKVHALINARYVFDLPTLVTTNSTEQDFKDLWGPTVESRIKTFHWIEMRGKVLRPRAKGTQSR